MPWRIHVQCGTPLLLRPDWAVSLRLPGGGELVASPPETPGSSRAAAASPRPEAPPWLARAADLLEEVYPSARLPLWQPRPEGAPARPEQAPELWVRLAALAAFAARQASDPPRLATVAQALHRAVSGEEAPLAPFLAAALGGWVRTRPSLLGERPDLPPPDPEGESRAAPEPELWQPPAEAAEGDPARLHARVEAAAREAAAEAAGLAWLRLPGEPQARPVAWFLGAPGRLRALLPAGWRPLAAPVEPRPVTVRIERRPG
ncbi:MAG: hypothetical protein QJR08_10685 [Bacillota bacterium]|nr:hypothetical protein [Bacillota bacterium]